MLDFLLSFEEIQIENYKNKKAEITQLFVL